MLRHIKKSSAPSAITFRQRQNTKRKRPDAKNKFDCLRKRNYAQEIKNAESSENERPASYSRSIRTTFLNAQTNSGKIADSLLSFQFPQNLRQRIDGVLDLIEGMQRSQEESNTRVTFLHSGVKDWVRVDAA